MHLVNPFIFNKFFLDIFSGANSAFSLRKLSKSYTGYCIEVERSSDSATLNIGFVNGVLDVDTMTSFVGANTGYVSTWYDQSGLGFNYGKSIYNPPKIINSGVLILENGNPSVLFDASNSEFLRGASSSLKVSEKTAFSIISVSKKTGSSQGAVLGISSPSSAGNTQARLTYDTVSGKISVGGRRLSTDSFQQITSSSSYTGDLESVIGVLDYENADAYLYLNSLLEASSTSFQTAGITASGSPVRDYMGFQESSLNYMDGYISEIITYPTSIVADIAKIYDNQNEFYSL